VKPPRLVEVNAALTHDFASNNLAFALQLRKIAENLSQVNRMTIGCSAPNAIRFVDLVIEGDGLDWPAVPCRPWSRVRRRCS